MDGLCRAPKTAALYVKAGAFQSAAITMGLGARRFHSDCPRGPVAQVDQDCGRHSAARWSHPDLPERHAKRRKYCLQAWRRDGRASRSGSTCARLLSRPEADASGTSLAPTCHQGDIRVTDPNSGVTLWEGDDD